MCHPVISYDFYGNKTWVVPSVPRKYITSLQRLRRIGCRDRESGLMLVINDVFSTSYHMLCRRYIDQNVLAKLTELTKDEEFASRFVNGSWEKFLNEIDEQEHLWKLDALKMK
ncbi:hypothetical protein M9H77_16438 [Catharanthus roseus]|uniref:Uncharacterized protein n=1 Tax=Catharanthus roseus TaxID=4058 RepID=A0ACC0B1R8_CATRO|nr:hypothetical protein M9H77_16438 [Catharanthus roseus]